MNKAWSLCSRGHLLLGETEVAQSVQGEGQVHQRVSTEDSRKGLPQGSTPEQRSLKLPSVTHVNRVEKRERREKPGQG